MVWVCRGLGWEKRGGSQVRHSTWVSGKMHVNIGYLQSCELSGLFVQVVVQEYIANVMLLVKVEAVLSSLTLDSAVRNISLLPLSV